MTDKARELLKQACNYIDSLGGDSKSYRIELAQPEVKRERLSDKEIETEYWDSIEWTSLTTFLAGVRFAEKHHGIGGDDDKQS